MESKSDVFKLLRRILQSILAVTGLVMLFGLLSTNPEEQLTVSGEKRNFSQYITMRDGVEIAIDVWLPAGLESEQQIPTLLRTTRYIRAFQTGFMRRIALGLGLENIHPMLQLFNSNGYALVLIDARGSGASSGSRKVEIAPEEVADMGDIVDWIVRQKWSNGKVGAFGVSYVGTTSEMLLINQRKAVKAVLPLFSDFDGYSGLIRPGGVLSREFIRHWAAGNQLSDSNNICGKQNWFNCLLSKSWFKGIKPVDSDDQGRQLATIIERRNNYDINETVESSVFIDDVVADMTLKDNFPSGHGKRISQTNVPMQVWVSWLDAATVDGAIARYNSFSNPQQLIIVPFNHGGSKNANPYQEKRSTPEPSRLEQYQQRIEFLDQILKSDHSQQIESQIKYFTMGENKWKTTKSWPPKGIVKHVMYLNTGGRLTKKQPTIATGSDTYRVDFSATTGSENRWLANLSGSRDIVYFNRYEEDKKLLVYDSTPLLEDTEITGVPIVTLQVSSTHADGAFYVYLEDVAPDGKVTYITEGILRASHSKLSTESPPFYIEGPYHSFKRQDRILLEKGVITEMKIGLITTSVLVKSGHKIRIAIAGHDKSVFERIPLLGIPEIDIHRSRNYSSFIELPIMAKTIPAE